MEHQEKFVKGMHIHAWGEAIKSINLSIIFDDSDSDANDDYHRPISVVYGKRSRKEEGKNLVDAPMAKKQVTLFDSKVPKHPMVKHVVHRTKGPFQKVTVEKAPIKEALVPKRRVIKNLSIPLRNWMMIQHLHHLSKNL